MLFGYFTLFLVFYLFVNMNSLTYAQRCNCWDEHIGILISTGISWLLSFIVLNIYFKKHKTPKNYIVTLFIIYFISLIVIGLNSWYFYEKYIGKNEKSLNSLENINTIKIGLIPLMCVIFGCMVPSIFFY